MGVCRRERESVRRFCDFLRQVYEEGKKNISKRSLTFETDVLGYLIDEACVNPVENFWNRTGEMVIVEKVLSCVKTEQLEEHWADDTGVSEVSSKEHPAQHGLPVSRARQLISFYTMSQNPNMTDLKMSDPVAFPPLWVRCDRTDPKQTTWLGAEPLSTGNNVTGITLHTITSSGPLSNKNCSMDLEELKESHRRRHRCFG
ncbi:protein zwilch homolog, partial [Sphaerodactylus townsendi]|uniref:protein zwilch homolog n=1 Tax=Sphaerodactylus townsendi TaxID=933632 RepID=UPI002025C2AF